ncbi:MAG: transcriptional regulator NrdR [Candidatus Rokuibacteriota bacterium]
MRCPYCRASADKVVDSRAADDGGAIRRRRECLACGRRYTTYERVEELGLVVRKRSGETEPFDRSKLAAGISAAVTGRPIDAAAVDALAAEIEEELRSDGPELESDRIGLSVLERLRVLDEVAYMRFASVYKDFEDARDFQREMRLLKKEPKAAG